MSVMRFEDLFGHGLLVYVLGHDTDAIEVLGYYMKPDPHSGDEFVVIRYSVDIEGGLENRDFETHLNLYDLLDEVAYYGAKSHEDS